MERLTERDKSGDANIIALKGMMFAIYSELSFSETNALTEALNRLAAYEDTGLEPKKIEQLKGEVFGLTVDKQELNKYRTIGEIDYLREFAQAEKDGRLVMLPCKPGQTIWVESWVRGRVTSIEAPNIMWIIENTEKFGVEIFLTREEAEAALKKREET